MKMVLKVRPMVHTIRYLTRDVSMETKEKQWLIIIVNSG